MSAYNKYFKWQFGKIILGVLFPFKIRVHCQHRCNCSNFMNALKNTHTGLELRVTTLLSMTICSTAVKHDLISVFYVIFQIYIKSEWGGGGDRGKEHPLARKAADTSPLDYCCQATKNIQKARVIFRLATSKISNVTERADTGNW